MQTEVKVRERDRTTVLSKREAVRVSEIGPAIHAAFQHVYAYLALHEIPALEAPFIVYHGMPGPFDAPFEIEICAPISSAIDPPEGWSLSTLPAGTFASIVHIGPYDSVAAAYDELEAWIAEHGFAIHGAPREVYLSEPGTPPAETRTVVEFPVAAAAGRMPEAAGIQR